MSYKYLIDSYAWVEYFRGTEKGKKAKLYIENEKNACATTSTTLAELSEKYKRENENFKDNFNFVIAQTKIINLDQDIAISAGEINYENKKKIKNWGMADSIILASANKLSAKVVTGDEHFKELNSIMIN